MFLDVSYNAGLIIFFNLRVLNVHVLCPFVNVWLFAQLASQDRALQYKWHGFLWW